MLTKDFLDMLSALSAERAEFLLVGAYAMAVHGRPRATGDLDVWVRPDRDNAQRVWRALEHFGAPLTSLGLEDLSMPGVVFQIGVSPSRIDLLTEVDGLSFEEAWSSRIFARLGDLEVPVIGRGALLQNKRASGRPKDLADVAWLEQEEE